MFNSSERSFPRASGAPSAGRLALLALCALLHWLVFDAISHGKLRKSPPVPALTVALLQDEAPKPVAPPARPAPKPHRPSHHRPAIRHRHPAVPTAPTITEPVAPEETADAAGSEAGMATPGTTIESATPLVLAQDGAAPAVQNQAPAAEAAPPPADRFAPPPSAELVYDARKVSKDANPISGHGTIRWQADGGHYTIHGEVGVLFFTLLTFDSTGELDAAGIEPLLYSEKPFRRDQTSTRFERDSQAIRFSASSASYPRHGGEQDRASILWQLAGIGRGNPERFAVGAQFPVFVAGVRDGETWPIRVAGKEQIEIGGEQMPAWHLQRAPRPGSHDQQIDFWLAPQRDWYPVRLRFTDSDGDYLELTLTAIHAATTQ